MRLERYSRQIQLKSFGAAAQEKLCKAKVLVVGAGGLGVPVLTYLNAMGVGELGIVDNDVVSISNLHRQVLYEEKDVGQPKVAVAKKKLKAQNSETKITLFNTYLSSDNALEIIKDFDCVVDASDNFPTRYLVNDACVILQKPFVYGALHGFEGQVSVFNTTTGPTYRCLFPTMPKEGMIPNCSENGVLGILPGIVGNLQALETVKLITGIGALLSGTLLIFDALVQQTQKIQFSLIEENKKIKHLQSSYHFDCSTHLSSIGAQELQHLMQEQKIQLVDVRTLEEFHQGHVLAALHIPLQELQDRVEELDPAKAIYFICQSGMRSKKAIQRMDTLLPNAVCIQVIGGMNSLSALANFA